MRISDWSSDVCSSDLGRRPEHELRGRRKRRFPPHRGQSPRPGHRPLRGALGHGPPRGWIRAARTKRCYRRRMNRQRSSPRFPWIVLTTWLAALLLGTAALAQLPAGEKAIAVSLVAEDDTPAAGETVTLAFGMPPKEGWQGYWKNPGDAGVQPSG